MAFQWISPLESFELILVQAFHTRNVIFNENYAGRRRKGRAIHIDIKIGWTTVRSVPKNRSIHYLIAIIQNRYCKTKYSLKHKTWSTVKILVDYPVHPCPPFLSSFLFFLSLFPPFRFIMHYSSIFIAKSLTMGFPPLKRHTFFLRPKIIGSNNIPKFWRSTATQWDEKFDFPPPFSCPVINKYNSVEYI